MDSLTFIDYLIGHLMWPLAVIGGVVFLTLRHRAAINALIPRIQKAKAGLFEVELAEAKASADRAELPPAAMLVPSKAPSDQPVRPTRSWPPEELDSLMFKSFSDPRGAVIDTYYFVHRYAWEASQRLDPKQTRHLDGAPAVTRADALNLLAPKQANVLNHLRAAALRALDPDENVSPGEAVDYVLLATRLLGYITGIIEGISDARKDQE